MKPQAILMDFPVPEKRIDGLPVIQLEEFFEKEKTYLPIFICIHNAQAYARKLKKLYPDYPDEYICGFGQ